MAWITLRQFAWTERPGYVDPYPEVDGIHRVAADRLLPVDLSYAISVNALAVPASGPIRYETRQHELRPVLCYLEGNPLRLREEPFRASAAHIRRFVSESIGLGMLTATVQAAYQWQDAATHIDVLPTALAGHLSATKTRPDLLFDRPGLTLAGEARGRSEAPPTRVTAQQRDRLNSLLPWSHHHGTYPLAMSWAYATGLGMTIDLFTRSGRLPGMTGPIGQPLPSPMPTQTDLFDQDQLDAPIQRSDPPVPPARRGGARDLDRSSARELTLRISQRVGDIADQLYATAPDHGVRVGGQRVRGAWAALDLLGVSSGSFLLGALEGPASSDVNARLRPSNQFADGLSAHVSRRLVVAITEEHGQPWHLVAD
ncbi:hypothetical protein LWC34_47125 [Kibdelosporangium philippinense]|uniref:Uncharacterized protein n=1 Tax=Kibdelosporangium philippinense TaxID=211113 RepID=A0ABS8ZRF0_9PSEU|nr:hypothetical protein [Kibdelosporangium philippinense]MCE7010328.1 hypothetical protein [Kibdelosporangium philippinense]